MHVRVMLVDDSTVVRGLITRHLSQTSEIMVVATATNGEQAIPIAKDHQPDIIVLDIEMPQMDGITALPKLLEVAPNAKIIMASTLTLRNADITLKALSLGASDYIAKPTAQSPDELKNFYRELRDKIFVLSNIKPGSATLKKIEPAKPAESFSRLNKDIRALAIASSTGGPQALLTLFENIKGRLNNIPIFITQHMPPMFTTMLANNLASAGARVCAEAKEGEEVKPGYVYIAPGDYHMVAVRAAEKVILRLNQNPQVNFCRPSADPMIKSLSDIYGRNLLVCVLTGMGQDGLEGTRTAVTRGASAIAQDEATSIVWGMPKAVATANLCSAVLPLNEIPKYLIQNIGN